MKNNKKLIIILLYPYLYMIGIAIVLALSALDISFDAVSFMLVLAFIVNVAVIAVTVINLIQAFAGKHRSVDLAGANMIIKLAHIPAYVIHFLLGCIAIFMSVWGIGFIIWSIVIDLVTIIFSGLVGASAAISASKEKTLQNSDPVKYAILSFIYCLDVIFAVIYNLKIKKATQAQGEMVL
ncbi:hypothetical protein D6853_01080 [Butyrivibrio sp. X503]|uniref:hypothetical protein n=1 Tax=Butyrivibrio sp. X503 TaxID=2364878 RepID=UPI000EAA3449|nr:hypothetical protein [Butyrivibrio sp. X503]RKM58160.1 hypothetical protein D6853_01080 [Butyrivibrio sp. X503]